MPPHNRTAPNPSPFNAASAAQPHVLLVAPSRAELETAALWLRTRSLHVVSCSSAEQAITALSEGAFDLLVTDLDLPYLTGTELARRWLDPSPNRHVVFLVAEHPGAKLTAFGKRAVVYRKPLARDGFLDAVNEGLARTQRASGAS